MSKQSTLMKATDHLLSRLTRITLGNWTTLRYAIAKAEMSQFEPIGVAISMVKPHANNMNIFNIELSTDKVYVDPDDLTEILLTKETWDKYLVVTINFPMVCPVDGVPTFCVLSISCTPTGILNVFLTSFEACHRLKDTIDKMSGNNEDRIHKAIEDYIEMESPVSDMSDVNKGFYSVQEDDNHSFRIHSTGNAKAFTLEELNNEIMKVGFDNVDPSSEKVIPEDMETISEMFQRVLENDQLPSEVKDKLRELYEGYEEYSDEVIETKSKINTNDEEEDSDEWI